MSGKSGFFVPTATATCADLSSRATKKGGPDTSPTAPPIKTRPEGEGDGWSEGDRRTLKARTAARDQRNSQQPL